MCAVLDFLREQPSNRQANAKGFKALFRRYAERGREGLTSDQFHLANKDEKIWRFRKGSLRIYCFEDGDRGLVVLTHGVVKKSQKAKRADIQAALAVKNQYIEAKTTQNLVFEEIRQDDEPVH